MHVCALPGFVELKARCAGQGGVVFEHRNAAIGEFGARRRRAPI